MYWRLQPQLDVTLQHTATHCNKLLQPQPDVIVFDAALSTAKHQHVKRDTYTWKETDVFGKRYGKDTYQRAMCVPCRTYAAPHCTTLHHTAPHCNILQHTTEEIRLEIFGSADYTGLPYNQGTPIYSRETLFEILGTPVKTCLEVKGTPTKFCWNFGSRNCTSLISSVCGVFHVVRTLHHTATKHTATRATSRFHTGHC